MSLRFRKSIRLAPGLRLNVSKSGVGVSVGPRGASIGFGQRGTYANVGIPGTGLSVRERIDSAPPAHRSPVQACSSLQFRVGLEDDGHATLRDGDGNKLSSRLEGEIKRQQGEQIRAWLEEHCEHWNQGIDRIVQVHLSTPSPEVRPLFFKRVAFCEDRPVEPVSRKLGILDRLSPERRRRVEDQNEGSSRAYEQQLAIWTSRKVAYEEQETQRHRTLEEGRFKDVAVMERVLADRLTGIEWPRETQVSYTIVGDGALVALDVDLPEIEEMPRQQARVGARGLQVLVRDKSDAQVRREYATHIHAVAFRLIGETFSVLPAAQAVLCSGYSQRSDKATGQARNDYLYSVRVPREAWTTVSFNNLAAVDPIACLERFEMRRKMTKTGMFEAIEPLEAVLREAPASPGAGGCG